VLGWLDIYSLHKGLNNSKDMPNRAILVTFLHMGPAFGLQASRIEYRHYILKGGGELSTMEQVLANPFLAGKD